MYYKCYGYGYFVIPILTCGTESWVLKKADKQRITVAEMCFLLDKNTNEEIWKELKMIQIVKKIKKHYQKK